MQRDRTFILLLAAAAVSSLLAMTLLPLADTSEPRYAEIARLMAESGDWISPWFSPGVPFWGKPPLSFWLQAASFRLFGVTELAARLPSWIATALTLWVIHEGTRACFDRFTARLAVIIYATCALVFISSGAVLTDPFLALASTLCMMGWLMAERGTGWFWRHAFFIGLAVGLLAKGPLILVLAGGAIVPWLAINPRQASGVLRRQRWLSGTLLVLTLVLPWYIAAELKTPGFLDYFIIGEHVRRFIDPGWSGDLYGTAHQAAHGTIWYYWLQAAFPWWIPAAVFLWAALRRASGRLAMRTALKDPLIRYFLAWALFTPLFFTFSGNILWTYVLPALAGFSVLLARAVQWRPQGTAEPGQTAQPVQLAALVAPAAVLVLVILVTLQPNMLKTEKRLVSYAHDAAAPGEPLRFLNEVPFSARFYSREKAVAATMDDVSRLLESGHTVWLAVARDTATTLPAQTAGAPVFESKRHALYRLSPPPSLSLSPQLAAAQGSSGPRGSGIQ